MFTTIFISIYIIITGLAFLSIVLYGAKPSKSLSWLLVILFIPFLGVLFYILFGINRRKFKIFKLKQTKHRKLYDSTHYIKNGDVILNNFKSNKKNRLAQLLSKNNKFQPFGSNKVVLLRDGEATFKKIFETISTAKKFIHIQYYVLEEGVLMNTLLKILKDKIEEGIEVRLLYDAIGSFDWKRKSIKKFKNIGVKIYPSIPLRFGSLLFSFNYRNHRKIIIIDGSIGFTGGFNISDKYIKPVSKMGLWEDTHVQLQGPVVESLHKVFIKDYYFASKEDILLNNKYIPQLKAHGNSTVQIISSGPDSDYAAIMQQYIMLINLAEKSISICNPYFIPSTSVLTAIKIAALSGVKVQILLPKKSDSKMAKLSMQSYFEELLNAGVEIYLNPDVFLHSKIMIIDGELMSIGSGNFDNRSFDHNFETNVLVYDSAMTIKLQNEFEKDIEKANKLILNEFINRSFSQKLLEGIAKFFSPLL